MSLLITSYFSRNNQRNNIDAKKEFAYVHYNHVRPHSYNNCKTSFEARCGVGWTPWQKLGRNVTKMLTTTINNPIAFWLGGISGFYLIFHLSKCKFLLSFKYWGENSLVLMGIHVPLIIIFDTYIHLKLPRILCVCIELGYLFLVSFRVIYIYGVVKQSLKKEKYEK